MFNWLSRWLINRRRRIFRFWDGKQWRYVDPLVMWRGIMTHPEFDPETTGPAFDRGDESAWHVVLRCTQHVFGITSFSERGKPGLTEQETILLFKRFLAYCDDLKKSMQTIPTSQQPTQAPVSTGYSVPPEILTSATAAFGSTSTVNSSATPGCC